MLFRRFAVAVALLVAALASQLPEFVQQYSQRLGGAIDELRSVVTQFDHDSAGQSLTRAQGIARLEDNPDPLAQGRGHDMETTVTRVERLERQRQAFAVAGPLSRYAVFAEDFDPRIAAGAYAEFEPALPVTLGGLVAALLGFAGGWLVTHGLGWPFRRRHRPGFADPAHVPVR
ncbi:DUF2937 family protein [Lichenifustis flavocetrariae]|uniref:DUF2937 family protein n=1 Tax=Lichenifustis flavocetrariae TaxID=2949735 RepID=A0AA41YV57_9HYPH|nr:DUF2937 family protein [Lichenifustis flavocetrariae]MCW6508709.1 DUF2937 family protein [Lichenifustis flavocetrariae]